MRVLEEELTPANQIYYSVSIPGYVMVESTAFKSENDPVGPSYSFFFFKVFIHSFILAVVAQSQYSRSRSKQISEFKASQV
jgi:predicted GNAT superfamily acetyltransferase